MTRSRVFFFASTLALNLAACAPATAELDGSAIVRSAPGTTTEDSPHRPTFALQYFAGNFTVPDCMRNVSWVVIEVDTNGDDVADTGTNNDYVEQMLLTFADGSTADTHNAAAFREDGTSLRFMTSALANEQLAVVTSVWLYDASGNVLGTLEPTLEDPWVSWSCPDPP